MFLILKPLHAEPNNKLRTFILNSFIPHVVCLAASLQSLSKSVLNRMRSSGSCLKSQYLLFSLRSNSSCLCFLPRLPFLSPCFSVTCFRKLFPCKVLLSNLSFLYYVLRHLFTPCLCAILYWQYNQSCWPFPVFSSTTLQKRPGITLLLSAVPKCQPHTNRASSVTFYRFLL
jgi:hypothetical protein